MVKRSISCGENFDVTSHALTPWGNVSKAFCSLASVVVFLVDVPSERFFGRPRSMIDASDSVRRWLGLETNTVVDDSERPLKWQFGLGLL